MKGKKSTFSFAIALLLIGVVMFLVRITGRQIAQKTSSNERASRAASGSAAHDVVARLSRVETEKERRMRMISDSEYRDDFNLSEQEVYMYVRAKGSNALSLVAAFESTRNK